MLARQRHRVILGMLDNQPSLRTMELAKLFDVTDETIRRDLEFLDSEGKLIRTHGGALRIERRSQMPLQERLKENQEAKQSIAKKALQYIKKGETIFLDASSTVLALAECLPDIRLTVITNAHDVVSPLLDKQNIEIITTGGRFDRTSHSYGGLTAMNMLKKFAIDKIFFSSGGMDMERGASDVAEIHAEFKENLIPLCAKRILLIDGSKLSVRAPRFFCPFELVDVMITDPTADQSIVDRLKTSGVNVI